MSGAGLDVDLQVPGRIRATFTADPGEVIALVGPNGAGKSTLLQALAGLVDATGRAASGGREILTLDTRHRRIGLVFQDRWLFPHLSALENVAYAPRAQGVPRAEARLRARAWLDRFGIGDLAARLPGQLSGGQAQRVSLARALASEPDLLMLDEPFTGMDAGVATSLRIELARHLADFGGVTLLVTHDPMDALTMAERVLVLEQGRIVQDDNPARVTSAPGTAHVARLLGLNVVSDGADLLTFGPEAVAVQLDMPHGSPRHRWFGEVAALSPYGAVLRVLVRTEVGDLIADVTPDAGMELGLTAGRGLWLAVKETAVRRTPARR